MNTWFDVAIDAARDVETRKSRRPSRNARKKVRLADSGEAFSVESDLDKKSLCFPRRQFEIKTGVTGGNFIGRGIEAQQGPAPQIVQPRVGQHDAVPGDLGRMMLTGRLALVAAHFEKIGEIGGETDGQPEATRNNIEIAHRNAFETGGLPQKAHAPDLHDVMLQRQFAGRIVKIRIGQIEGQRGVVVAGRRTQQDGPAAVDLETEAGQIARIVEENALGTIGAIAGVAIMVEQAKDVAMLERAWPQLMQRGAGGD